VGVSPYSYNSSNQLLSTPNETYTYDYNGNTLTKTDGSDTTSYSWDFENRLTSATLPNVGTTIFRYDPFGRRIQKSGPLGTTNYVYDVLNVVEEVDNGGSMLADYTHGMVIDETLSMLRGGTASYDLADGLGSVTSLSTAPGALANTYTYDSFGKLTASSGTVTNPIQYAGREFDKETGLYFNRARYYDPTGGRFISEDPIGFGGGSTSTDMPLTVPPICEIRVEVALARLRYLSQRGLEL
jgi:RHS repeat-associated protein